ncbi:MAG: MYXO-CTERM sorting domain-containing protein [Nannocystaceae bacterium]|nr:MYXO-CTERM sorting domain-containing protein [bacterium]
MVGSKPRSTSFVLAVVALALPATALANPGPKVVQNPSYNPSPEAVVIDLGAAKPAAPAQGPSFSDLDAYAKDTPDPVVDTDDTPHPLGNGLVQVGSMVMPQAMLEGAQMVPDAAHVLSAEMGPVAGGGGAPDIEEICAFPEEVPPGIYDYDARPGGETPRFATVYMNYLGGTLSTGAENSAENLSQIARSGHPYPVYAGGEARAIAAAQAVAVDFADWAVRVVYEERPPKVLPYTMVMMGGHWSDTTAGPSGGVAPIDCEDFGQRNVCYVFQNASPAVTQANIASQEIGHTLGLGHTTASDSVMASGYAPTQGGDLGFNDSCAEIITVQGQAGACTGVNRCHCGDPDLQHDKNTMFATFAEAGVDMVEPTIVITDPPDGTTYEPGQDVIITVDPWDDVGGYGWQLTLEDAETGEVLAEAVDYDRALEFKLIGVPEGSYRAIAMVQDHADQTGTDEILFTVGNAEGGSTGGDESGGADETGAGDSSGTDADAGTGGGSDATDGDVTDGADTDGDSGGQSDDAEGCGCTTDAPAHPATWLLLPLGLLGLRRRR